MKNCSGHDVQEAIYRANTSHLTDGNSGAETPFVRGLGERTSLHLIYVMARSGARERERERKKERDGGSSLYTMCMDKHQEEQAINRIRI